MIIAPVPQPHKNIRVFVTIVLVFIILAVAALLYFRYYGSTSPLSEGNGTMACSTEAKLCPDGSYVGRSGPNCDFADCPSQVSTASTTADLIHVSIPLPNQVVVSPLLISGQARGSWYFEASFPVKVYDADGLLLGTGIAQAQGDWMTDNFVPFTLSLTFKKSTTTLGTIVFKKDNPSGLPQNDNQFVVPIRFK